MNYPKHTKPTPVCRCWQCGAEDPMGCGNICADCSWEAHLEAIAHTGHYEVPMHDNTPPCCWNAKHLYDARVAAYDSTHPLLP